MPYILLACLSLLWGTSFLLVKVATRALDPFAFAFGRVGIGALVLLAAALLARRPWPRGARLWLRLAAMAIFGQIVPFLMIGAAGRMTTSADLALMMGAAPIFTMLASRAFGLGEVWGGRAGLGLALGLAGLAISLGSPAAIDLYPQANWGRAIGLVAAMFYATGAMISRAASREIGPSLAATWSLAISTLTLGAIWWVVDGPASLPAIAAAPPVSLLALLALGVFNTALAYFVYFRLVVIAGATFGALNNYIVPFIGMFAGFALLDEPVALAAWFGLALVIASVILTGGAAQAATAKPQVSAT